MPTKILSRQSRFRHAVNNVTKAVKEKRNRPLSDNEHHEIRQRIKDKLFPKAKFDPHSAVDLNFSTLRTRADKILARPYDENSKSVQTFKARTTHTPVSNTSENLKARYLKHKLAKSLTSSGYNLTKINKSSISVHIAKRLKNKTYTGLPGKPVNSDKRIITPESIKKGQATYQANKARNDITRRRDNEVKRDRKLSRTLEHKSILTLLANLR